MSHSHERKDKDCLNCGAVVYGRYCHICGQENVVAKETFGHLVTHFIYDITHFDGKFFSSVKYLLLKPGFLSVEYMRGRRASYLNPIKMYVFTSAFFFIFFFSVFKPGSMIKVNTKDTYAQVLDKINTKKASLQLSLKDPKTPAFAVSLIQGHIAALNDDLLLLSKDSTKLENLNYYNIELFNLSAGSYKTVEEYEAEQSKLKPDKRDSWLEHQYQKKKLDISARYAGSKNFKEVLLDKFMHSFPQILFVSLPLYGLLLQLVYVRRKSFYYADHIIYTVHLYCALFIMIFLRMLVVRTVGISYIRWLTVFATPISVYAMWYIYKSMRTFYGQSRIKTIMKFLLLVILSSFVMSMLFALFFLISILTA